MDADLLERAYEALIPLCCDRPVGGCENHCYLESCPAHTAATLFVRFTRDGVPLKKE